MLSLLRRLVHAREDGDEEAVKSRTEVLFRHFERLVRILGGIGRWVSRVSLLHKSIYQVTVVVSLYAAVGVLTESYLHKKHSTMVFLPNSHLALKSSLPVGTHY